MRRVLIIAALIASSSFCQALQFRNVDDYTLDRNDTVQEELWVVAANSAQIEGTLQDDLLLIGNSNRLHGVFQEDVVSIGNHIVFNGTAEDNVRLLGRVTDVNGQISGNLVAVGSVVVVGQQARVGGDVVLAGQSVVFEGSSGESIKLFAQSATLGGRIGGNVSVTADDIVVMPGTEIAGDLRYRSRGDLLLDKTVTVGGKLIREPYEPTAQRPATEDLSFQFYLLVAALLVALPITVIFPHFVGRSVRMVRHAPWKSLLVGAISFALIPMAALFISLTIIGLPLGLLLGAAYAIMLYISKIVVALALGSLILRRRGAQPFSRVFTTLFVGLLIIYAMVYLPGGMFAWFLIVFFGLGAMILSIASSRRQEPQAGVPPLPPSPPPSQDGYKPKEDSDNTEKE